MRQRWACLGLLANVELQTSIHMTNRILRQNEDKTIVQSSLIKMKTILCFEIICLASQFHNSIFPTTFCSKRSQIVPGLEAYMDQIRLSIRKRDICEMWIIHSYILAIYYLFMSSSILFHLLTKHNWKWHLYASNHEEKYAKLIPLEVNRSSSVLKISSLKDHQQR